MGPPPHHITPTEDLDPDQRHSPVRDEIQGLILGGVLGRVQVPNGQLTLARFRAFVTSAMGDIDRLTGCLGMGYAGFQGLDLQRRSVMRVAAAHGFGHWAFQDHGLPRPLNPPLSLSIPLPDRSKDAALSPSDWNAAWRSGVQGCLSDIEDRMYYIYLSGELEQMLQSRLGQNAQALWQTYDDCLGQYRRACLTPAFERPSIAAGGFLLAALKGAGQVEIAQTLRVFQQFPYQPAMRG